MGELISSNINYLQDAVNTAFARRSRHITSICVALFLSIGATVAGMVALVYTSSVEYGEMTILIGSAQVVALISIVLGLILHHMNLARATSSLMGILRNNLDTLHREIADLSLRSTDEIQARQEAPTGAASVTLNDASALPQFPAREATSKLQVVQFQINGIVTELETTVMAFKNQPGTTDVAVFAYGFAVVCLLSACMIGIGSTKNTEFLRALLLGIGTISAISCYAILTKPTIAHFLVEQCFRRLGFSIDALVNNRRTKVSHLPPTLDEHDIFDPIVYAIKDMPGLPGTKEAA
jgi:hypothetical protein